MMSSSRRNSSGHPDSTAPTRRNSTAALSRYSQALTVGNEHEHDLEKGEDDRTKSPETPDSDPSLSWVAPIVNDELSKEDRQKKEEREKEEAEKEANRWLVQFDGPKDPRNPMNFSKTKKCLTIAITGALTFVVSFDSSIFSATTAATSAEFGVSEEVMILGVSLYVLGFSTGPLIWGPMSERIGRFWPIFIGMFIFTIFQIPVAVARNLETVFLARFFSGVFGAAPLGNVASSYPDYLTAVDRGVAFSCFAASVFMGPVLGPIAGAYVTNSSLGWRWTAWIVMIMSGIMTTAMWFFVPETSHPVILQGIAAKKRLETKQWAWHSKLDESPFEFAIVFNKYLLKPFKMLFAEPILMAIVAYCSLVYSILYLIFFAYPYNFHISRSWSAKTASLPFIALAIGVLLACVGMAIDARTRFARNLKRRDGKLVPEDRLPPMIVGSVLMPIGLFWFAWTSSPNITPWPQIISGVFIGMGITTIFFNALFYTIDVYLLSAPSAMAINAFIRALMAAGFPLFATPMYQKLGIGWATSLLAFLCLAMMPFPTILYLYGHKLRARGTYSAGK